MKTLFIKQNGKWQRADDAVQCKRHQLNFAAWCLAKGWAVRFSPVEKCV